MQHVRHIFITIKEFRQIRNLITIHTLAFQSQGIVNISYRIVIQVTLSYSQYHRRLYIFTPSLP